jgi:hypothetical protein
MIVVLKINVGKQVAFEWMFKCAHEKRGNDG